MSNYDSATLKPNLGTVYAEALLRQWNASAKTLSGFRVVPAYGTSLVWGVQTSGTTAQPLPDGYGTPMDFAATHVNNTASLEYGQYFASAFTTDRAVDLAKASVNGPSALQNIVGEIMLQLNTTLVNQLGTDAFTGNGSNRIFGIVNQLVDSGSLFGLPLASFPELRSNVINASGAALSDALLGSAEKAVAIRAGTGLTKIVMHPDDVESCIKLFLPNQRLVQPVGKANFSYDPDQLTWRGIPISRDRACPSGTILGLNEPDITLNVVAHQVDPMVYAVQSKPGISQAQDTVLGSVNMPMYMKKLADTGPKRDYFGYTPLMQVKVGHPKMHFKIVNFIAPA